MVLITDPKTSSHFIWYVASSVNAVFVVLWLFVAHLWIVPKMVGMPIYNLPWGYAHEMPTGTWEEPVPVQHTTAWSSQQYRWLVQSLTVWWTRGCLQMLTVKQQLCIADCKEVILMLKAKQSEGSYYFIVRFLNIAIILIFCSICSSAAFVWEAFHFPGAQLLPAKKQRAITNYLIVCTLPELL